MFRTSSRRVPPHDGHYRTSGEPVNAGAACNCGTGGRGDAPKSQGGAAIARARPPESRARLWGNLERFVRITGLRMSSAALLASPAQPGALVGLGLLCAAVALAVTSGCAHEEFFAG